MQIISDPIGSRIHNHVTVDMYCGQIVVRGSFVRFSQSQNCDRSFLHPFMACKNNFPVGIDLGVIAGFINKTDPTDEIDKVLDFLQSTINTTEQKFRKRVSSTS